MEEGVFSGFSKSCSTEILSTGFHLALFAGGFLEEDFMGWI